jgi:4-carboxymuconolactone decarboxylase
MASSEEGMAMRRRVLGDANVDRAIAAATDFDRPFQEWITENVWGDVWSRPGIELKTRSLVTIAILGALDRDELELHLRAARNTGVTKEEITEVLLHVAVYAGVPAANRAFQVARAIFEENGA